jgi:transposase
MLNVSIGVDLHKHQFTCYFLKNNVGSYYKFSTDKSGFNQFKFFVNHIKSEGYHIKVAVESTGNTRYFKNEVEKLGIEVVIVNTLKFKVVNESVNKTDKRDAKTIAEFLSKDMIPEVHLSSEESERLKRLLNSRKILVDSRVRLKNQIHGILLGMGIKTRSGQLNSKKGRITLLKEIENADNRMIVEIIIKSINPLDEQIKNIELKLDELTENDRMIKILESIPGTGKITSATVRAYIDDIERFSHFNKLSAYCGLVPKVKCSDRKEYYGSITKRGPVELRTALIQMVLGLIRYKNEYNSRLMYQYRLIKKNKGSGKALVATARKLTKVIWTLLSNDEEYDT